MKQIRENTKKAWIILMAFFLLSVRCPAETDGALYPFCEADLWGYMNRQGETVIEPQWQMAYPFRFGLAKVKLTGDGRTKGLINLKGEYAAGPGELWFYEYDHAIGVSSEGGEGYYDRSSGFYLSPNPAYRTVVLWGEDGTGPIAVENQDGLIGYLDRASGEPVIPFRFTGEADDIAFHGKYAFAADEIIIEDAAGRLIALGNRRFLINEKGDEITFEGGVSPVSAVYDGIFVFSAEVPPDDSDTGRVTDDGEETASQSGNKGSVLTLGNGEEAVFPLYSVNRLTGERKELADGEAFLDGDDGRTVGYGIAKTDGTILYGPDPALWKIWEPDGDGMLCIVSEDGLCGHMNRDGQVMAEPRYRLDTGGSEPRYTFSNGYAVIRDIDKRWPDSEHWVILDTSGKEVFSSLPEMEESQFWLDDTVMEGGLLWYFKDGQYGLMRVREGHADFLTEPVFEDVIGWMINTVSRREAFQFHEGLHPVMKNGLYGYIDAEGTMVIPEQFQAADSFRNGLAMVLHEGKYAYIDHDGTIVWEEKQR